MAATGEQIEATAEKARDVAKQVASAIVGGVAPVADRMGQAVRSGVSTVGEALADPGAAPAEQLVAQADLPEIEGADPLAALATRLDREADLWRGVAMRQLARAAWMDRLSVTGAVALLAGVIVLAAVGAFRALFGAGHAVSIAVLLGASALVLALAAATVAVIAARTRASQIQIVRHAMDRADRAEAGIRRAATLMELRGRDAEGYVAALRAASSEAAAR